MKTVPWRSVIVVLLVLGTAAIAIGVWWRQVGDSAQVPIGVMFSGSGPVAPYGKKAEEGVLLAIEQYEERQRHAAKPVRLRVVREDAASVPRTAVAALEKLISVERVAAVLGPEASSLALACAPIANERGVVLFAPTIAADIYSTPDDFTFRNWPSSQALAGRMAEVAAQTLKYRSVGILYVQNDMGASYQKAFSERFTELGGSVSLAIGYSLTETDFRGILAQVQGAKLDALYLPGQAELGLLLRQKAEMGISVPVMSGIGLEDPKVLQIAGPHANDIVYTAPVYDAGPRNPKAAEFEAAYVKRFGRSSDIFAATSYDAANLVLAAVDAGARDSRAIRDWLYTVKNYPGVTGVITIDRNGDAVKAVGLKKIIDGRPRLVDDKLNVIE